MARAISTYKQEVESGEFPAEEHVLEMEQEERVRVEEWLNENGH